MIFISQWINIYLTIGYVAILGTYDSDGLKIHIILIKYITYSVDIYDFT